MPTPNPRPAPAELPDFAVRMIGRFYFGTTCVATLASATMVATLPSGLPEALRLPVVAALVLFALLCGGAVQLSARPRFPLNAALGGAAVVAILLSGLVAVMLQDNLRSPVLGFCGLLVVVVGAITGAGYSLVLGAVALAQLGALAWAETSGLIAATRGPTALAMVLLYQWLVVVCSVIGGILISWVLGRFLHSADEREQRFRGLLRIAVDWYWEQDQHFRFSTLSQANTAPPAVALTDLLQRTPWQVSGLGLSGDQLDAHRADLEAHRPFSALLARRRDSQGRWRTVSLSGEPKFDAAGAFCGYWGVARDVTDEVRAQRAMTASETRYRELFTRSPSPLVLHRRAIVFDANEAAARLFGFANAAVMNGFNLLEVFPLGEMREHALRRLAQLERMAVGEALPVADAQLRSRDGHALSVQATAVRVETSTGPANLAIFFDITARQAAEGALRRSEAMLSHLFANSPDCITLTEMASGRYALVNPAFCRLTGFSADEVVGRTAAELGLWHDQRSRDQLLERLLAEGRVVDMPAVFVAKSGALVSMLLAAGRFMMDGRDYLVLNARDVTESELTRLQHSAILERATIGIALTRDRRFVQANPFFERMLGWELGTLIDQPGAVVWASEQDYREIGELAGPLLAAGLPFEAERRVRRRDNSQFWCRMMAQVVDRNDPNRGTIWIAEDVTERRRLDDALAAARDAAEAASQAKSSFLANTSHEIRTPLNGLIGLARLAMQDDLIDARRQQYLAQILDSAQSLAGIMSDILDVSKIEAGKITLEDTPFELHDTLSAVHHAYHPLAEVKGLALRLTIDAGVPATVRGDPLRVRQILSNFITNALKFTERGEVHIEACASPGERIRLEVSDTGPGVALEAQPRLFQPFTQGDSSTTRRYGGTGLGLSICRELAQLMGGTVGLRSTPGQGSSFWAELPLPASTAAEPAASTEADEIERLRGTRVLMVEDNAVNMMIAVAMLEHWGVRVVQAFDGRAAVDAVHAAARDGDPFDAVLMDVQMPVMGGHEAARELRRRYGPSALTIVALTAAALVSERDEALEAGMDDFLTKPIDAPKLRRTLARRLALQRRPAVVSGAGGAG